MSKQREALQAALDALEKIAAHYPADWEFDICVYAKNLLREALAEPEPEPVARVKTVGGYPDASEHTVEWLVKFKDVMSGQLLYTARPASKPLTEPELNAIEPTWPNGWNYDDVLVFVRSIERAHGINEGQKPLT